ncbi:MAG TPA: DUF6528 family protein [Sphingobacteriaceae bacterium]
MKNLKNPFQDTRSENAKRLLREADCFKLLFKLLFCAIILSACTKNNPLETSLEETSAKQKAQTSSACTTGCWIGTVNHSNKELELYSWYAMDWNVSGARTWNWKPTTARGYTSTQVSKWGNPNDFKIREVPSWGGNFVAAIGNGGLVTIINYSTGNKRWAVTVGSASVDNIHGVELLPNGNIAVAASTGGYVRLYASSGGATTYASYALAHGHAVLWDPGQNRLWALGGNKLVKLSVGTASTPALTVDATYTLPTSGGHAIGAKYGNINELYVSSGSKVYIFNKTTTAFTEAPGLINRVGVKAISNQPDGVVVLTRPDAIKTPVPSDPATVETAYNTSYVDYYTAAGAYIRSGHRVGASYYKGFVYNTNYQ